MTHSITSKLTVFSATLSIASLALAVPAFAKAQFPGTSERQWSVTVRGGVTYGDGGEQPQFGALITHPGPGKMSYGVGFGYEQAYSLNIIPVFVDLRLASVAPDFIGGTPGLFFEAGYAAVFGDTFDRNDLSLGAIRILESQGNQPTIDGEGYYLNFGIELERQLSDRVSYVLEFGSRIQSIPGRYLSSPYNFSSLTQNVGAGATGGTQPDFILSGRRGTLSSLSITLGLRF